MKSQNLDNARKLRGIYFIDAEYKEFKETIKNARKKLETPMAPAYELQEQARHVSMVWPVVDPTKLKQDLRVF